MDDYLQKLELFYDEKMKFSTKKDKYIKCEGCNGNKEIIETGEKLILSCEGDKDCGIQIEIILPKYIKYDEKIEFLKKSMNSEYNWEALNKYLNVSKEMNESNEKQKKINEEIKRIEKLFYEKNMELKQKELQTFYDKRIKKTKKCKEIEKKMKNNKYDSTIKKQLMKEYIQIVQEINNDYIEIKELLKDINPYLIEEEPSIKINDGNYVFEKRKVSKTDDYKIGMKVSWLYKSKRKYGTITELKGKGARVLDENGKEKIRMLNTLSPMKEEDMKEEDMKEEDMKEEDMKEEDMKEEVMKEEVMKEEVMKEEDMKEEDEMKYFSRSKDNKWLSTFNKGEPFDYEGNIYPTIEHAFHAQKVNDEKKEDYQKLFVNQELEPNEAKKMGGKKYFQDNNYNLREDWNSIKLILMEEITKIYYSYNPEMLEKLKSTGDKKLIHTGFRIDNYWGIKNGEGENNHGKILMKIREKS
jgi:ribA/ribD-fused uncharacterized protein